MRTSLDEREQGGVDIAVREQIGWNKEKRPERLSPRVGSGSPLPGESIEDSPRYTPKERELLRLAEHMSEQNVGTFSEECVHLALYVAAFAVVVQLLRIKEAIHNPDIEPLHPLSWLVIAVALAALLPFRYGRWILGQMLRSLLRTIIYLAKVLFERLRLIFREGLGDS